MIVAAMSACVAVLLPAPFSHGVAAGDVTESTAVLWTRADSAGEERVDVAPDAAFAGVIFTDAMMATDDADLTVKVDVAGLSPGTTYFYRFTDAGGVAGEIGQFRTAPPPEEPAGFRFVFTGDSNFAYAPFNLLASVAEEEADFFIWFGDVTYADAASGDVSRAVVLNQYRAHYRQDRTDENLRRGLASTATWVGWDDHEGRRLRRRRSGVVRLARAPWRGLARVL
jgi:alkaline phosphatase D